MIGFIIITPLCGFLFSCGCTWPLLGLAEQCNYFDRIAMEQCPWCVSAGAGGFSVGLTFLTGYLVSTHNRCPGLFFSGCTLIVLARVFYGLTGFLITAVFTAWFSATLQDYSGFIFWND